MTGFHAPRKSQKKQKGKQKGTKKKAQTKKKQKKISVKKLICSVEKLISLVRESELIWKRSHPQHGKRNPTKAEWIKITKNLGLKVNDHEVLYRVRSKWCRLNKRFQKELTKSALEPKNYKPSWDYFKSLSFLRENSEPAESADEIDLAVSEGDKSEADSNVDDSFDDDLGREESETSSESDYSEEYMESNMDTESRGTIEVMKRKDRKNKGEKQKVVDKKMMKTSSRVTPTIKSVSSGGSAGRKQKSQKFTTQNYSLASTSTSFTGQSTLNAPVASTSAAPQQNLIPHLQPSPLLPTQSQSIGSRDLNFENGTDDCFFDAMKQKQKKLPILRKLGLWKSIAGNVEDAVA